MRGFPSMRPKPPVSPRITAFSYCRWSGGQVSLGVDCAAVLNSHERGIPYATGHSKIAAGIWRQLTPYPVEEMRKVKAHRAIEEVPPEGVRDFWGNHWADVLAKRAAEYSATPTVEAARHVQEFKDKVAYYRGVARILSLWPYAAELFDLSRRPGGDSLTVRGPRAVHELANLPDRGGVACVHCWAKPRSAKGVERLLRTSCPGLGAKRAADIRGSVAKGHKLRVVRFSDTPVVMYICLSCGRYSMHRFQGLGDTCRPQRKCKGPLNRFFRGLHPTRPWRIFSAERLQPSVSDVVDVPRSVSDGGGGDGGDGGDGDDQRALDDACAVLVPAVPVPLPHGLDDPDGDDPFAWLERASGSD